MKKETLKNIFKFLEEKGEYRAPIYWKLKNNIPITEDDLHIKGDLELADSEIKSLPKGLEVDGYLDLFHCANITSLPEGLKVESNLYIVNTPLTNYSDAELREMIKPGFIRGKIIRL